MDFPAPAPPRRNRLGGCLMGLAAIGIVCVVAGILGWQLLARPYARDLTHDRLEAAAATQVVAIGTLPVPPSGRVTITDEQVNRALQANPDRYAPLEDPTLTFAPSRVQVAFDLYGTRSTYTAGLAVANGSLTLVNGKVNGPAGRVLTADDAAAIVEQQLAALLARSDRRVTGVGLGDGTLTIETAPSS